MTREALLELWGVTSHAYHALNTPVGEGYPNPRIIQNHPLHSIAGAAVSVTSSGSLTRLT